MKFWKDFNQHHLYIQLNKNLLFSKTINYLCFQFNQIVKPHS